jgi:hypothetical protein
MNSKGANLNDVVLDKKTACQKAVADDDIIKDLRIRSHSQRFTLQRLGNVPLEHQTIFSHIQQLEQMRYDSYALQPRPDIMNKPWELEDNLQARRISRRAEQSRDSYQNEDD